MTKKNIILLLFILIGSLSSQSITWNEITSQHVLPNGVKLFQGVRNIPKLKVWYYKIDFNSKDVAIKPYFNPIGKEGLVPFVQRFNAYGGINGGFFDTQGSTSYSALVNPDQLLSKNIQSVVRDGKTYFLTRSFFGFNDTRDLTIDWIYHFGNRPIDIYRYNQPTPNAQGTPAPTPSPATGKAYYEILAGIGGGPTLVKNGAVNITYTEEVFWGSGVGLTNRDPRTAVGFTPDKQIIMLVADGRYAESEGLSLTELANLMIELGCNEAMNLDGGGSSQIAVGSQLLNSPEGGSYQRPIPTILAIVKPDSIPLLPPIFYNKKSDTEDPTCTKTGNWQPSTVAGYWGTSPSIYVNSGNGSASVEYIIKVPKTTTYDVFAWWTAASNRATNTPFVIDDKIGIHLVRKNQSINGTKWNKIGTFTFDVNKDNKVTITDDAEQGKVVIADAIRIISTDSTLTAIEPQIRTLKEYKLAQNYPNPFNPVTKVSFTLPERDVISLKVYDLLGREVAELLNEEKETGTYQVDFDGGNMPSGIYICRMTASKFADTIKMLLIK